MVDLGHMARQSTGLLQTAGDVLTALEDCVLYRVNGPYRAEATGLSCYYSYNGDLDDLSGYAAVGAGEAFKHFYSYELTGELDHAGMQYIADLNYHELPDVPNLMTTEWDGIFGLVRRCVQRLHAASGLRYRLVRRLGKRHLYR